MNPHRPWPRSLRIGATGAALLLLGACGGLLPKATSPPAFYALDGAAVPAPAGAAAATPRLPALGGPTLLVLPPHASAGYDSAHIIYTRRPHQIEHFAHSEWVETPARMLAPLIVTALQGSGAFQVVALSPSPIGGDLTLDTEILRLQQEFAEVGASQVRFTLRAYLVDKRSHKLLAWREFDQSVAAASDDPEGGVAAANRAVRTVLEQLAVFCADATQHWPAATADAPRRAAGPAPAR
jgi:cholesterol transport system auxiliary component